MKHHAFQPLTDTHSKPTHTQLRNGSTEFDVESLLPENAVDVGRRMHPITPTVLLSLQRTYGNQWVQRLLGRPRISSSGHKPNLIQRVQVTEQDEEYISQIEEKKREKIRETIRSFTGQIAVLWGNLKKPFPNTVEGNKINSFYLGLYNALVDKNVNLSRFVMQRQILENPPKLRDQSPSQTLKPPPPPDQSKKPKNLLNSPLLFSMPQSFTNVPSQVSIGEITSTGKLTNPPPIPDRTNRPELTSTTSHEYNKPEQVEDLTTETFVGSQPTTKRPLPPVPTSKQTPLQKPPRPIRTGLPFTTPSSTQPPTEPIPDDFDAFLAHVWKYRAYYRSIGEKRFYEEVYKASATKAETETYNQEELSQIKQRIGTLNERGYTESKRNKDTKGVMTQSRVYVNTKAKWAATVFSFIVQQIVPINGVQYAKLADPEGAKTDRDVIVIYISDKAPPNTEDLVIQTLSEYQSIEQNANYFVDEVPRLTKRRLTGVSTGDEPPDLYREGNQYLLDLATERIETTGRNEEGVYILGFNHQKTQTGSFSTYRSLLIYTALKEAQESNQPTGFKQLVWKYFQDGGISQSDPSKQGKITSGRILELTGILT